MIKLLLQDNCLSVELDQFKPYPEEACYIQQKDSTVLPLESITYVYKEVPIARERLIKEAENGSIKNFTDKVGMMLHVCSYSCTHVFAVGVG